MNQSRNHLIKKLVAIFNILLLTVLSSSFAFAEDKPKEEWLFAHIADEAQMSNNTTIDMPVTRGIRAFTDRQNPTGEQFAAGV